MKSINLGAVMLIIFMLGALTGANAQWAQEGAYLKLGTWNQKSTSHFTNDGERDDNGLRTYFIPGLYARVGIDGKWTVTASIPVVNTSQSLETVAGVYTIADTNVGDIDISLEYQIYKDPTGQSVWGVDLTAGLPTGKVESTVGSGDGELNRMVRLLYGGGYKLGKQNFYVKSSIGLNDRTLGYSNEFRGALETGTFFGPLFVLARFNTIKSLKNEPIQLGFGNFADRLEETTLGVEATYDIGKNFGLSAGYNIFLGGQNRFSDPSWTAGIVYQIKKKKKKK